jgi:lipid II:glycine glycyltransferase (peptidoglycan interpeptide bridge formation enzyme)
MIVTEEHRGDWNRFIAQSPCGDVLQCWEWGELKSRTDWSPLHLATMDQGRITAAALVLKRRLPRTGRCLFYCPRGPVVDYSSAQDVEGIFSEIRRCAREHGAIALKIDPALENSEPLYPRHLQAAGLRPPRGDGASFGGGQPKAVMKVDISGDEDTILAGFHSKWRYNIRLAARKGVQVTTDGASQDMDAFYDVLQVTAKRDGFRIRARSYFQDMWDHIVQPGMGKLLLARVGDVVVAGALLFALGHQCWYVYGASDNEHRNLMPNHLVQWEAMRWAREQGCTVYDMRGVSLEVDGEPVDPHIAGLNRFKRGFGARYIEYVGDWDMVLSPLWYALFQRALPMARRLMAGQAGAQPAE